MTTRAERVYLSFFEGEGDNAPRLARALRQALAETKCNVHRDSAFYLDGELRDLCDELEDPNLLYGIYGNCCD